MKRKCISQWALKIGMERLVNEGRSIKEADEIMQKVDEQMKKDLDKAINEFDTKLSLGISKEKTIVDKTKI